MLNKKNKQRVENSLFSPFHFVIGCGQCGERFHTSFESELNIFSIAINFNKDTDELGEHIKIIEKGGTGRKKELGRVWFDENRKDILDFISDMIKTAEKEKNIKVQNILLVSGEAGGAGSAICEKLRNELYQHFNLFVMSILPSSDEGVFFREESLKGLKRIREDLLNKKIKGIFLVNNQHVNKVLKIPLPPTKDFNENILEQIKKCLFPINNEELDFSSSYKYPDFGDFNTVLTLPKEFIKSDNPHGFFDIRKIEFEGDSQNFKMKDFSLFSENVDVASAKSYFSILILPNFYRDFEIQELKRFISKVFKSVDKKTKAELPFKIVYFSEIEDPEMYMFISGCNISKKLLKEIENIGKGKEKFQEKIEKTKTVEDEIFDKL